MLTKYIYCTEKNETQLDLLQEYINSLTCSLKYSISRLNEPALNCRVFLNLIVKDFKISGL